MGKAADLREFDRGQIVMTRRHGTSITETARLVGCSRSAVVSIHAKWINGSDTSSRRQGDGRHASSKKKEVGDCPACRLEDNPPINAQHLLDETSDWLKIMKFEAPELPPF
ncbi:hypothetical protein AVEN_1978-1 [Araneus ventricosus]|uniref:Tc3 transposase DNA binding domain-containing protein n=1 Tax=Araneus ventricosus TaxID=182803 RepID=A0A4Y2BQD7_ARAVE|nr:hypothetical protein AVEN_1978-1 [Araneus ventricosus]